MMQPDGTQQRQVTTGGTRVSRGTWSPDGRFIAFHAEVDSVNRLYQLDMTGCPGLEDPNVAPTVDAGGPYTFTECQWPTLAASGKYITFRALRETVGVR